MRYVPKDTHVDCEDRKHFRPEWDEYFLGITKAVGARADCRRAQHGCVIVKDRRIVSSGYNGAPSKRGSCLDGDCPRGLKSKEERPTLSPDYSDCISVHAEQNAVAYASRDQTKGATAYITGEPCDMCRKILLAAGIERAVYPSTCGAIIEML